MYSMISSSFSTQPVPTPTETIICLREDHFDTLDKSLNNIQRSYERGELSEQDLHLAFQAFTTGCWTLGEKIRGWIEAHPESYAAHQAHSQWLLGQARRVRGGTTSDLVSDRGSRGVQGFLQHTESAVRYASGITARPLLSHLHLGNIQTIRGCNVTLQEVEQGQWPEWFRDGLALEPHSLLQRQTMLLTLRTEWGGSEAHMLAFLRGQEAELSSADRQKLWAQFNGQIAHHALHFARDTERALEYAGYAANLAPRYHYDLAYVELVRENKEAARSAFMTALQSELGDPHARLGVKGFFVSTDLYDDSGQEAQQILEVLRREADGAALDAFQLVARHLRFNPRLQDKRGPRAWLEQGLIEGDNEAGRPLVEFVRDTTRDPVETMRAALFAADEGSPEAAALVWNRWRHYRRRFKLDDRAKYRYLLNAADGGDNFARVALARLLKSGRAELGSDGILRLVRARPTQDSREYAQHLRGRAKHEGFVLWKWYLAGLLLKPDDMVKPQREVNWWLIVFVGWLLIKLVIHLSR
jgi:hypothetical protein